MTDESRQAFEKYMLDERTQFPEVFHKRDDGSYLLHSLELAYEHFRAGELRGRGQAATAEALLRAIKHLGHTTMAIESGRDTIMQAIDEYFGAAAIRKG